MSVHMANSANHTHQQQTMIREAWIANYKRLLLTRLRTLPYEMIRRSYPQITFPFPLTSSQYIIDGIIWALHDNCTYIMQTWQATVDHMAFMMQRLNDLQQRVASWQVQVQKASSANKKRSKRESVEIGKLTDKDKRVKLQQNVQHIKTEQEINDRVGDAHNSNDQQSHNVQHQQQHQHQDEEDVNEFSFSERQGHELRYKSYAAVQDVYMTFCVIDALLKLTSPFTVNSTLQQTKWLVQQQDKQQSYLPQQQHRKLSAKDKQLLHNAHRVMQKELPRLVVQHLPLFTLHNNASFIYEAVEQYRFLFLDLLRSWQLLFISTNTFGTNTNSSNKNINKSVQVAQSPLSSTAQRRLCSYIHRKLKLLHWRLHEHNLQRGQNVNQANAQSRYIRQVHDALHVLYASITPTTSNVNNDNSNIINRANGSTSWQQTGSGNITHSAITSVNDSGNKFNKLITISSSLNDSKTQPQKQQQQQIEQNKLHQIDKRSMNQMIDSFLNSIYPAKGSLAYRSKCTRCGLIFATSKTIPSPAVAATEKDGKSDHNTTTKVASANYEGRNAHYKCHSIIKQYLSSKAHVVRLCYPSAQDFIRHVGDYDRSGYFPQLTATLEEASKNADAMFLQVRKLQK